jgi:uncharacterized repeat protein (TIGR02543 family)
MKSIKKLAVLVICWLFTSLSADVYAQTTINLSSPGTLKNVADIKSVTQLTITGVIDARDFKFMRDSISNLAELDLSGAAISAYYGNDGTSWGNVSYPANEIPRYAFYNSNAFVGKTSLTSIILPDGLTSIGSSAFSGCSGLTSINIPDGVTTIENSAFFRCSGLTSINIPDGVTTIGYSAFQNCSNLNSIIIPVGVTTIESSAFQNCSNLNSITIPVGLVSIKAYAFSGCSNLTSITNLDPTPLISDNYGFDEIDKSACELKVPTSSVNAYQTANVWKEFNNIVGGGLSFKVDINNNNIGGIAGISSGLYPPNTAISLTAAPAEGYSFIGWTSVGNSLSSELALNFTLTGDTVIIANFGNIGSYNLTTAGTLSDVEDIKNITHITLTGVIDARDIAFMRDSLPNLVELDLSGTAISAYYGNGGTYRYINEYPANVMPAYSFSTYNYMKGKASLTSIILPDGVTSIGENAFSYCPNLTSIMLPDGLISIGNRAFLECVRLTSINIPNGVTYIGSIVFGGCRNLTAINIPNGITSIEPSTFTGCNSLTSINVPDGVTAIGSGAFARCGRLISVNIPDGVTAIEDATFGACISLSSINIPDGVTTIGESAFSDCRGLTSITIPDGVFSINGSVFFGCSSLTSIILPDGVTSIGYGAFSNCSSLTSIDIPDGVIYIGYDAFSNCSSLTSIDIPDGVTSIEYSAFAGCSGLTSITFPAGITSIRGGAFSGCSSLTSIILPAGLTSIENSAFADCNSLTSITNLNPTPINVNGNVFTGVNKSGCELKVSASSENAYKTAEVWKEFNISGGGVSFSINNTNALCSVIGIPSGLYPRDTVINLTAVPAEGFSFKGWTSNGDSISSELTLNLTLTNDTAIIAHFWNPRNYNLTTAGTLKDVEGIKNVTHLTLTGNIDARDIAFMRDGIPYLAELDLGGTTIVAYSGTGGPHNWYSYDYPANEMPKTSFHYTNRYDTVGKITLTSVVLPAGVTSIGYDAFAGCNGLNSIVLPVGLTFIESSAFYDCNSLTSITNLNPTPIDIYSYIFYGVNKSACTLKVPSNSIAAYQSADVWKEFNIIGDGHLILGKADNGNVTGGGLYAVNDSVTLTAIPNPGYQFTKWTVWNIDGHLSSTDNPFTFKVTVDTIMYAHFEAIDYRIIYELNGGVNHPANDTIYTVEDTIILRAPTKPHYDFAGWAESDSLIMNSVGDRTFTALWQATKYNIAYELNGGVNHSDNPVTYTIEDSVILKAPTKAGYEFAGWAESDTIAIGSTGDRTFTAQWHIIYYSIAYELNGGVNHPANDTIYTVEDTVRLYAPTKTGYEFAGWAEGDRIARDSTGNRTFTAQWHIIYYSIAYELNGGVNHPANDTIYTVEDTVRLYAPTKTGYEFAGWAEGDRIARDSTGNRTFTAQWHIIHYSITYELNGGVNHPANDTTYTVEDTVRLYAPTKTGYEFAGWAEGDTIARGSTGNRTFTAQWHIIHYSITYELDGGVNHPANDTTYTVEDTVRLYAPTKTGYEFAGWAEGDRIARGSTGNRTFTAQWNEITTFNIIYELNGGANHTNNPATYTIEDSVVLKAPTKRGYNFAGWHEGGVIAKGSTGDRTFTAQWTIIFYEIIYELNGGVNHPANDTVYTVEDTIVLKDPQKTGYNFAGWRGDTIIVNSVGNKILTATWDAIRYSIRYELNGGANHTDNPATYTIEDSVVLKVPTKRGYNFAGWHEGGVIAKGSTGDRTFTAQWTIIFYEIIYELNGGVNHPANDTVYTVEDTIVLKDPQKIGYDFVRWRGDSAIIVGSTGNKSFTAVWRTIAYSVNYELNGGKNHSDNPATYTVEDSITLKSPAKTGYTFTGWTENGLIAKGSVGDRNFTAAWEAIAYNITYKLDDGVNHFDNPATYTVEDYIVLKAPTKDGFIFEGWVGDSVIFAGSTGEKTFIAQWKCVEANIEEITIDEVEVDISDSPNDSVFEYTVQKCEENSVSLNLGASSQANVTVNGSTFASGTKIPLQQGNVTTVNIQVESERGDSVKNYQLNIAAPINIDSLYYRRWNDVIAINRNPATNGGYNVSDVRWYKDGEQVSGSNFVVVSDNESVDDYHSEIKTENTNAWHRVCATIETTTLEKVMAYPNPVPRGEKVSLQLPDPYVGSELNIYDIKGSLVKSGLQLPVTSNSIDVSELVPGIYLLHINNRKGNIEVLKMIVE